MQLQLLRTNRILHSQTYFSLRIDPIIQSVERTRSANKIKSLLLNSMRTKVIDTLIQSKINCQNIQIGNERSSTITTSLANMLKTKKPVGLAFCFIGHFSPRTTQEFWHTNPSLSGMEFYLFPLSQSQWNQAKSPSRPVYPQEQDKSAINNLISILQSRLYIVEPRVFHIQSDKFNVKGFSSHDGGSLLMRLQDFAGAGNNLFETERKIHFDPSFDPINCVSQ